jgi:ferric-dicitrate binding protein FerR (iron transport regulator)
MQNNISTEKIIWHIASKGKEYAVEINDWLNESDENKKIYLDIRNLWQLTGKFPPRFSPNRQEAWQKVRRQIHVPPRQYILYRRIAQIAAALIVILLSVWFGTELDRWEQPVYSEVISPAGQKTRVILPDQSVVLLNGGSQIRYSSNFNGHDRTVELQGEGYFDVQKDHSKQFVVHTDQLNIKVFGTSFNVKAYKDDQIIEVGLKSGQIGIDRENKEITRLQPGQVATFNKDGSKLVVGEMDIDLVSAWTNDELIFEERSMEEIMESMERWYGVDITVAPELLDVDRFTFRVKTESLRELLELINLLKPIKYKIEGKQVMIIKP